MNLKLTPNNDHTAITLNGRLDLMSAQELQNKAIAELPPSNVILDITNLDFLDSSGIATFVRIHRHHQDQNYQVAFLWPKKESVKKILQLTRMDDYLNFFDSHQEVKDWFAQA